MMASCEIIIVLPSSLLTFAGFKFWPIYSLSPYLMGMEVLIRRLPLFFLVILKS
jgi:hypothetical protein